MTCRILFLCSALNQIGGIEKYNRDFISALNQNEVELHILERKIGGIPSKIRFLYDSLYAIFTIKFDYVICGHLHFSPIALFAKKLFKINYSISVYGIEVIKVSNLIHKYSIYHANLLVVISAYTKQLLSKQFQLSEDKYFMLRSSVDENQYHIINKKESLKNKYNLQNNLVVLTLSRMSDLEEKGHHRVLSAMLGVLKKRTNVKYVIAGPGSDQRIQRVINEYPHLESCLVRLGPVNEKQKVELYNLCDVFILPSKNEGFGIVFIEALACGAHVIASNAFGCAEGLMNGKLGNLVNPDDINSITETILQVLESNSEKLEENRKFIRNEAIKAYGYGAWCRTVKNFTEKITHK